MIIQLIRSTNGNRNNNANIKYSLFLRRINFKGTFLISNYSMIGRS